MSDDITEIATMPGEPPNQDEPLAVQSIQLGMRHHVAGRLRQAEAIYRQVLGANPDNAEALHLLGIIANQSGKPDLAVQLIEKSIKLNPASAVLHYNLAKTFRELGLLDKAVASYRKALSIQPDYADACNNLGNLLSEQGRPDEAALIYRQGLASEQQNAELHYNLGKALKNQGRLKEAIGSYNQALTLRPDFAAASKNLGIIYQELGQIDEAVSCFRRVLALEPDYAEAYHHLSFLKKHIEYDDDICAMEGLYRQRNLSDEERMHLAFGLGKSFEDLGNYDRAFGFILEANRLMRASYKFSIPNTQRRFERTKKVFSTEFFSRHKDSGNPDATPVFVVGMPRSGTTLVEQILASHPLVFGAGELSDISDVANNAGVRTVTQRFPDNLLALDASEFSRLGAEYINRIRKHSHDALHITDKMPHNFRYIGFIRAVLPKAKIILCLRDPMDNCLSIFKNYFSSPHKYAYDLTELGQYYRLYLDLMDHWRRVLPGIMQEVRYEELVADQENQSRKLIEYIGLPWDDACLSFHETKRRVSTISLTQVRRSIYTDSVQLWRRYEKQLEPLRQILCT